MQLYALEEERPILAHEAKKQKNYRCPECLNPLRLREGPRRQAHFYHLKTQTLCRQHHKSLAHLRLQLLLSRRLAGSRIERPYPQIGRIADVSWESEKIIFEIQCSPISLNEAKERCRDYKRLGLNVVWILHDRQFNKKTVSEAEAFLRTQPCYFVSDREIFYDQFDIVQGVRRLFKGPPLLSTSASTSPQKARKRTTRKFSTSAPNTTPSISRATSATTSSDPKILLCLNGSKSAMPRAIRSLG